MCGRVFIKTSLSEMMANFRFAAPRGDAEALSNGFPLWNGTPSLEYPIIVMDVVREPDVPGPVFMRAAWGFVPYWAKDPRPGGRPPPINGRAESVATSGMFRGAYAKRRALMPIDGFFEWRAVKGQRAKQPYAIAMKSGEPFALAAIWEMWRDPETGNEVRTFAVITCGANRMMATIHDRMPVILHPEDYRRWLSDEADPRELLKPFPSEPMTMWPVDRKVGAPGNNTPDILNPIEPDGPDEPELF